MLQILSFPGVLYMFHRPDDYANAKASLAWTLLYTWHAFLYELLLNAKQPASA